MIRRSPAGLALAIALAAGLQGCAAEADQPIYIALAGPVSQANGRSMKLATEMAVEEINRAGILGRRLELVIKDDQADPARAIEVAAELRDDPRIVAVVGHLNSSATLEAAEIYNDEENGLLQISPASSNPRISDAGPWTFRVCPSDLMHGPALADWAYGRLGLRRVAVLYANDEYGRGVLDSFAAAFEQLGGAVIARDPYLPEVLTDDEALDPYLERAIRNGMDGLAIAGQANPGGVFVVSAARRLGYRGPVLGADGLTGLKDAGPLADGTYISSAFLPDRNSPEARTFVQEYRRRYNEMPDHRGAMAYDVVHLLARAIRDVMENRARHTEPSLRENRAFRRELRDYIAGVGSESAPYQGVSGTITFDENGDVVEKEVTIGVVRNGVLVTASR